jgi:hypothetical protein
LREFRREPWRLPIDTVETGINFDAVLAQILTYCPRIGTYFLRYVYGRQPTMDEQVNPWLGVLEVPVTPKVPFRSVSYCIL